jgi:exosortase/archaeosortase family protein
MADAAHPVTTREPGSRRAGAAFEAISRARWWPALLIGAAALAAYHYTLATFLDNLGLNTPLAYLPLLPVIAVWASWEAAGRFRGATPPIRDRQLDHILGIPLLLIALFLITVTPVLWGTFYWALRPDVLSFALFVTGAVILAYGLGWAWRMRAPLLLLFLMWPALYIGVMSGVLAWFVHATDAVLGLLTTHLPLGVSQVAGSPSLLAVHPATGPVLQVSVSAACAGGDGVLGFLLIGGALMTAVDGPIPGRLFWLAAGVLMTFVLNVGRIVAIVLVAGAGHPEFALGGFHAVVGLVLFGLGVAAMLWLLPAFGLSRTAGLGRMARAPAVEPGSRAPGDPAPGVGWPSPRALVRGPSLRRASKVVTVLLGLGLFLAADQSLGVYARFANGSGSPTVAAMTASTSVPNGWQLGLLASYPWGTEYFGPGSSYVRYQLVHAGGISGDSVLWADVVTTSDHSALLTYSVENCFLFHNYHIVSARTVDLGHGVTALLLNYSDPAVHGRWATVTWTWPVTVAGTSSYERIELTSPLVSGQQVVPNLQPSGGAVRNVVVAVENFFNSGSSPRPTAQNRAFRGADAALESFGARFVAQAVDRPATRV